jgi:OOP family OmpA-OmpF porin
MRRAMTLGTVLLVGCAGELRARHSELSDAMQEVINDGAHGRDCAPKASALAEANLEFAAAALEDHKLRRARKHLDVARRWIATARAQTTLDCIICEDPGRLDAQANDRDDDGYLDVDDACPEEAEDFDAIDDDDGCPD